MITFSFQQNVIFVSEGMAVILDSHHESDIHAFKISEACSWLDLHVD